MSTSIIYTGLDVHKDSITTAAFEGMASEPFAVDRLGPDLNRLRRYVRRLERYFRGTDHHR